MRRSLRPRHRPTILAAWSERRIIAAMRASRDGCGPLRPWFRATPFAAAHHYRERDLPVDAPGRVPPAVARFAASLAGADPATLRIFDVPAATGLWLAYTLRRRCEISAALCWNAWWDPKGVLDGRHEIVLLDGAADRGAGAGPRDVHRPRGRRRRSRGPRPDPRSCAGRPAGDAPRDARGGGAQRRGRSW